MRYSDLKTQWFCRIFSLTVSAEIEILLICLSWIRIFFEIHNFGIIYELLHNKYKNVRNILFPMKDVSFNKFNNKKMDSRNASFHFSFQKKLPKWVEKKFVFFLNKTSSEYVKKYSALQSISYLFFHIWTCHFVTHGLKTEKMPTISSTNLFHKIYFQIK